MESKKYWDTRYKEGYGSGDGSYGEGLRRKLEWLRPLEGINSISELGCGDFNFGSNLIKLFPDASYYGTDISEEIVTRNQNVYSRFDFTTAEDLPEADLVLCVDVLLHVLNEDELEPIFKRLENAWTKYLVITAYERDEEMTNHVRIRKFDPARFGTPILREVAEDDGSMYFYIFKK